MKILDIFSKRKEKKADKVKIVVDNRERNSSVVSYLMDMGLGIVWKQLDVGDYEVNGVVVERKTVSDFKSSIISRRIIQQLLELRQYRKKVLIVEGIIEEDVYNSGMHENAFRGFMLSVALEFEVPVIFTHNSKDTAKYLYVLAKKKKKSEISLRAGKIFKNKDEQIRFILEGFPNVGAVKAKKLLGKFGSLRGIFNASLEELEEILGKRAKEFEELLD